MKGMKLKKLAIQISIYCFIATFSKYTIAESTFDSSLLMHGSGIDISSIDLEQFSKKDSISTGTYNMSVSVNMISSGEQDVLFTKNASGLVVPVFTVEQLKNYGINVDNLPMFKGVPLTEPVDDLTKYIPDASVSYQLQSLSINISVPQIAMVPHFNGYVDPELLDNGISALVINYFLNYNRFYQSSERQFDSINTDNFFGNINAGLNWEAWRLRTNYLYSYSSGNSGSAITDSQFTGTYVKRSLQSIKSTLKIGEISSGGDIIDSVPMKGVTLASNDRMDASSIRGYAPIVESNAISNSTVTIRQNGNVIYQTFVAPGPFRIEDIPASGLAGDMEITVEEENGTKHVWTQAYSSLPVMQRQGSLKYEISSGRYDGGITVNSKKSYFVLGSFSYGLPKDITIYGGTLLANGYTSLSGGMGISLGVLGALSADITQARADIDKDTKSGQSYRIRYSKSLLSTGTSFDLTALRFTSKEYYGFSDFNNSGYKLRDGLAPWLSERERYSLQTSISQSLGKYGSLNLRASKSNYWGNQSTNNTVGLSYNNNYKGIGYGIGYSIDKTKDRNNHWSENRMFYTNIYVPFSVFSNSEAISNMSSTYSLRADQHGETLQQVGVTGNFIDNKISYGAYQSYDTTGNNYGASLNATYSGPKATVSGGYSYSDHSHTMNANLSGAAVVHSNGMTLSPILGETIAIINAEGAKGAKLSSGAEFDRFGNTIVTNLTDYSANTIAVNVDSLPNDVTFRDTSMRVYPTEGAVIKRTFKTKVGYQVIININSKGKLPPFGSIANLIEKESNKGEFNTGIVGSNNQLYMSGLPNSGQLFVKWGAKDENCMISYSDLREIQITADSPVRTLALECR